MATLSPSQHGSWAGTVAAFLAEKQRRSGSLRTVQSYRSLLHHFFTLVGKTPDQVTSQEVFSWAYGKGSSGKLPSANTISARIAALSSFYRFLIRMSLLRANPCDALERPRSMPGTPRGLSTHEISRLLAAIPDSRQGLRD